MFFFRSGVGLSPHFPSPPEREDIRDIVTDEAAVRAPLGKNVRVTALVAEGDLVAKGAAVACLRHAPDVCFVAPISGRVARISLLPGGRLSEVVIYGEDGHNPARHDTTGADESDGVRTLMQHAGMWPSLRRRPFGGMPGHDERPSAIIIMATDSRPLAVDPQEALDGREDAFTRGIEALERLTDGPVLVAQPMDATLVARSGRSKVVRCGHRHPQGLAGIIAHRAAPARLETPVWDIHAEDVANLGNLVSSGELPQTRLVRVAGAALREGRLVRTHPGADLRQLVLGFVSPGPHTLLSGSPLDGHDARWLAHRHRQVTVLPRETAPPRRNHWLRVALTRSAEPMPAIPSAALDQAFGAVLPGLPLIRALNSGDDETAMALGVLSLLEEDLALADYVLGQNGRLMYELRQMLDRIEAEYAA